MIDWAPSGYCQTILGEKFSLRKIESKTKILTPNSPNGPTLKTRNPIEENNSSVPLLKISDHIRVIHTFAILIVLLFNGLLCRAKC